MLAELQIADFAIINRLTLQLHEKFNVFTGETGAGKSIIIDALGVVLGDRASPDLVRAGASTARVQALFQLDAAAARRLAPVLEQYGIEPSEDLILTREINANGRSTARANGVLVPVSALREIGEGLVDITGQSEHLSLLRPSAQLDVLDQYAHSLELRDEVSGLYRRMRQLEDEISSLVRDRQEAERRADMLRYQIEDIESVGLQPGEDEELAQQRNLLSNAERLSVLADTAYNATYGREFSALDLLREAETALDELVGIDPSLRSSLEMLQEAAVDVEEAALAVRRYRDSMEYDPEALAQVEERLDQINRLKRKYGSTVQEVLAYLEQSREELDSIEHGEERTLGLRDELEGVRSRLSERAAELSRVRRAAARELGERIERALEDLLMARARVEIEVAPKAPEAGATLTIEGREVGVDSTGSDRVEILLAANPGEPLRPLAKVASGGETSRVMLALRSVLSEADQTPTLIFDEVDVGVGGRSGGVVGEKLYGLARDHQVITITHLAQVAAYADAHYRIAKQMEAERTSTRVDELVTDEEVRAELAAMLGGLPVTERSLRSADELLARARQRKPAGTAAGQ